MTDDKAPAGRGCTITWWGHATVEVRMGGARVLTDPLLRRRVGPLHSLGHRPGHDAGVDRMAGVDAVLLSHLHRDHTDLPSLRRFGPATTTIVPAGAGPFLRRHVRGRVEELPVGASSNVRGIEVSAAPAVHDGRRRHGGPVAEAVGYLLRGSCTVYFAGDTAVFPDMTRIPDGLPAGLDVALLPVSGWGLTLGEGHMDPDAAAAAVLLLRPRAVVPIHWGTLRIPVAWRTRRAHHLGAADRFARLVRDVAPATTVLVPVPGSPIALPLASAADARTQP